MPQFAVVSRERHAARRWRRPDGYGFAAGDAVVPVVGAELARLVLAMPIAFVEQAGRYQLVAVLSLTSGRNMFVEPHGRWLGSYIPAWYRSYPFRLLMREGADEPVLGVDEDGKLVADGAAAGEDFFDAGGNPSKALKPIVDLLMEVERSRKGTQLAVSALAEVGVIQPWPITLKTEEAERTVGGLYRIDEAALNALGDDAFVKLRKASALPVAYAQMLSRGQLGVFEHLAKLHAQLAQPVIAKLPKSIDSLFGMGENDIVQFR